MANRLTNKEEYEIAKAIKSQGINIIPSLIFKYDITKATIDLIIKKYNRFGLSYFESEDKSKRLVYKQLDKHEVIKAYLSDSGSLDDICQQYKILSDEEFIEWFNLYQVASKEEILIDNLEEMDSNPEKNNQLRLHVERLISKYKGN